MLINWLTGWLGGSIAESLKDAYSTWKNAETQEAKLEAEKQIAFLTAQKEVLVSEQRKSLTSWIRPAMAAPVVFYVWKLIVWDTILGLGVTPDPGEFVNWIVVTVIGAYMLTRPFEKR